MPFVWKGLDRSRTVLTKVSGHFRARTNLASQLQPIICITFPAIPGGHLQPIIFRSSSVTSGGSASHFWRSSPTNHLSFVISHIWRVSQPFLEVISNQSSFIRHQSHLEGSASQFWRDWKDSGNDDSALAAMLASVGRWIVSALATGLANVPR